MNTNWREVEIHFGKNRGTKLGDLPHGQLEWWVINWFPNDAFCRLDKNRRGSVRRQDGVAAGCRDCILRTALSQADDEVFQYRTPVQHTTFTTHGPTP